MAVGAGADKCAAPAHLGCYRGCGQLGTWRIRADFRMRMLCAELSASGGGLEDEVASVLALVSSSPPAHRYSAQRWSAGTPVQRWSAGTSSHQLAQPSAVPSGICGAAAARPACAAACRASGGRSPRAEPKARCVKTVGHADQQPTLAAKRRGEVGASFPYALFHRTHLLRVWSVSVGPKGHFSRVVDPFRSVVTKPIRREASVMTDLTSLYWRHIAGTALRQRVAPRYRWLMTALLGAPAPAIGTFCSRLRCPVSLCRRSRLRVAHGAAATWFLQRQLQVGRCFLLCILTASAVRWWCEGRWLSGAVAWPCTHGRGRSCSSIARPFSRSAIGCVAASFAWSRNGASAAQQPVDKCRCDAPGLESHRARHSALEPLVLPGPASSRSEHLSSPAARGDPY